ncbi:hypothetical protein Droror1_Dr00013517 [Drosera rotundifolia]
MEDLELDLDLALSSSGSRELGFSSVGFVYHMAAFVHVTKGLTFEEVEKMWKERAHGRGTDAQGLLEADSGCGSP